MRQKRRETEKGGKSYKKKKRKRERERERENVRKSISKSALKKSVKIENTHFSKASNTVCHYIFLWRQKNTKHLKK